MALIFVKDDATEPARYGAMAAILAARLAIPLVHLEVDWRHSAYADACQHVIGEGKLTGSGLLWAERLLGGSAGQATGLKTLLADAATGFRVVVLAAHSGNTLDQLISMAKAQRIDYQLLTIRDTRQGLAFSRGQQTDVSLGYWRRDRFGRWINTPESVPAGLPLRIALIGARDHQFSAYPATLAALGDASDQLAIPVEVVFADPLALEQQAEAQLAGVDGLLLPGGAAMENVRGQISAARYGLRHNIPTLGLCLGMQTMTTALCQRMLGSTQANLAESDPLAAIKTFVPLAETPGHPHHRLGDDLMLTRPGTLAARLMGPRCTLRYNHRYQLAPSLKEGLGQHGLIISGTDTSGTIADIIECQSHRFYMGAQGHPELSSASGKAHPLLLALISAAQDYRQPAAGRG
ncbi:glutamine amidotransferase-related protein [Biostraticola tofi]|uniref:CTP synthase (glutamine hydrolyzing) n=1 Tax=Biostraticola tofi TaxID=466109 RepID=A0A4R3YQH8_9GAMM|nr:gamma-glutamyl-gamma-aminobutyrate hydrolase family protein [Biostraticola tofi]TCV95175.1 CTP synthase [Biostraticola tofi]